MGSAPWKQDLEMRLAGTGDLFISVKHGKRTRMGDYVGTGDRGGKRYLILACRREEAWVPLDRTTLIDGVPAPLYLVRDTEQEHERPPFDRAEESMEREF